MGNSAGPDDALTRFLVALLGAEEQRPGDLASGLGAGLAVAPFGLLGRLNRLKRSGSSIGDAMLREHTVTSPRMREFIPVGEEGAAMKADPWQTILDLHGKPKASPPGSGPKPVAGPKAQWPSEADLDALKTKLRKPKDGQ
jgi:hypothetical protein